MAADNPAAPAVTPPVKAPKIPSNLAPFIAPFAKILPKPQIGTVVPAPPNSLIY